MYAFTKQISRRSSDHSKMHQNKNQQAVVLALIIIVHFGITWFHNRIERITVMGVRGSAPFLFTNIQRRISMVLFSTPHTYYWIVQRVCSQKWSCVILKMLAVRLRACEFVYSASGQIDPTGPNRRSTTTSRSIWGLNSSSGSSRATVHPCALVENGDISTIKA